MSAATGGGPHEPGDLQRQAHHLGNFGVVLPGRPRPVSAADVLRELYVGTPVSWADVFGNRPSSDELTTLAARISAETTILWCYLISHALAVGGGMRDVPLQGQLAGFMFSELLRSDVLGWLNKPSGAGRQMIFHQEQLLLAAKLAMLYGQPGGPSYASEDRRTVGHLLLGVNDFLSDVVDPDPPSDGILGFTVRVIHTGTVEPAGNASARMYDLLVTRAKALAAAGVNQKDLDLVLKDATGLSVEDHMALGAAAIGPFGPMNEEPPFLAHGRGPDAVLRMGEEVARLLPSLGFPEAALNEYSAIRAEFQDWFSDGAITHSSFAPFYEHPFLRTESGGWLPINHRVMVEALSSSSYWALQRVFARKRGGTNSLGGEIGRVLEPYVNESIARSVEARGPNAVHISGVDVPRYRRAGQGQLVDGSDAYVVEDHAVIVFEITGTGIPIGTMVSGDGARFRTAFEARVLPKFKQLDRVTGDLISGDLVLPNLPTLSIRNIYPVLLTLSPFPQFPNIWSTIREDYFHPEGLFDFMGPLPARVPGPFVITVAELEQIEPLIASGRFTWRSLLEEYWMNMLSRHSPITNHLHRLGIPYRENEQLGQVFRERLTAATENLRARGFPES